MLNSSRMQKFSQELLASIAKSESPLGHFFTYLLSTSEYEAILNDLKSDPALESSPYKGLTTTQKENLVEITNTARNSLALMQPAIDKHVACEPISKGEEAYIQSFRIQSISPWERGEYLEGFKKEFQRAKTLKELMAFEKQLYFIKDNNLQLNVKNAFNTIKKDLFEKEVDEKKEFFERFRYIVECVKGYDFKFEEFSYKIQEPTSGGEIQSCKDLLDQLGFSHIDLENFKSFLIKRSNQAVNKALSGKSLLEQIKTIEQLSEKGLLNEENIKSLEKLVGPFTIEEASLCLDLVSSQKIKIPENAIQDYLKQYLQKLIISEIVKITQNDAESINSISSVLYCENLVRRHADLLGKERAEKILSDIDAKFNVLSAQSDSNQLSIKNNPIQPQQNAVNNVSSEDKLLTVTDENGCKTYAEECYQKKTSSPRDSIISADENNVVDKTFSKEQLDKLKNVLRKFKAHFRVTKFFSSSYSIPTGIEQIIVLINRSDNKAESVLLKEIKAIAKTRLDRSSCLSSSRADKTKQAYEAIVNLKDSEGIEALTNKLENIAPNSSDKIKKQESTERFDTSINIKTFK